MKAQFLPLFNVNLSQLQLNSTSTQFQLNFNSTSSQAHFNLSLNINLNLNSIWLWHKSNPILLPFFLFWAFLQVWIRFKNFFAPSHIDQQLWYWKCCPIFLFLFHSHSLFCPFRALLTYFSDLGSGSKTFLGTFLQKKLSYFFWTFPGVDGKYDINENPVIIFKIWLWLAT